MEKKNYNSFVYLLPFKVSAVIASFIFLVLGILFIMLFAELWDKGIYSLTYQQITEYISEHAENDYLGSLWIFELGVGIRYALLPLGIMFGILYLSDIIFIFASLGHKRGFENLVKFPTSEWALDVLLFLYFFVFLRISFGSSADFGTRLIVTMSLPTDFSSRVIIALIYIVILYFVSLYLCMNFALNLKAKTVFKNMLTVRIFGYILRGAFKLLNNTDAVKKIFIYFGTFVALEWAVLFLFYYVIGINAEKTIINLLFLINVLVFIVIVKVILGIRDLEKAQQSIIAGNIGYKLDEKNYRGDLKILATGLNSISTGLENAVNERLKSERFKTELITNVSHDIKTPLTSIINYTDLLKKENIETAPLKGYIEILGKQSEKLKKLVYDLLEASKASSGSLKVDFTSIDIGLMIEQIYGEYKDRFENANLMGIMTKPEKVPFVKADVNHLFRVFDNIFSNIIKFAQSDTRVYIDITKTQDKVLIEFKNISRERLNISGEELIERFVRGDHSRNTEGSGLGLSIAKSLMELMNGELKIAVDGDLFKVAINLPLM